MNRFSISNPVYLRAYKCKDLKKICDYSHSKDFITCWGVIYNPLTSFELLLDLLLRVDSVSLVKYILVRFSKENMFHLLRDEHMQKLEKVKLATKDYNLFVLLKKAGIEILECDYLRGKKSALEYRRSFINEYYYTTKKHTEKRRALEWINPKEYRWIYIDYNVYVETDRGLKNEVESY